MVAVKDLTGLEFGKFKVIKRDGSINHRAAWLCLCFCGKEFVRSGVRIRKSVPESSCGCMLSETRKQGGKKNRTHGLSRGKTRKLYDVYKQMIRRCQNPECKDYPRYGARGIKVLWSLQEFIEWAYLSGYRDGLTIERIDNNGNYEPSNCAWIVNEKQALNRERNHIFTYNGKTQDIRAWSEEVGINYYTLRGRLLNYGWPIERALTAPKQKNQHL